MVRVESQQTRQALLVVGSSMELSPPPEKLELFTEDGVPVDVGKDRTRARWRGTWVNTPEAPYEQNDFVMDDDKLWILVDPELVEPGTAPSASTSGAWAIMTISSGMRFFGEWAPGGYKKQSVVTHDDMLWVANDDIDVVDFQYIGGGRDYDDGTGDISIPVPAGAQEGDLMVFAGVLTGFSVWPTPTGVWTTLLENPLKTGPTPPGRIGVYAKVVEAGDLGANQGFNLAGSEPSHGQLHVFRGASVPIPAEVDFVLGFNDTLATVLVLPAGTDPAETESADKVMRIFAASAQNFVNNSSDFPTWESSSDGHDQLLSTTANVVHMGAYWSDPGASNPPDYNAIAGEHKNGIAVRVRLPSPADWDEDAWTVIADFSGGLPSGGAIGMVLTKTGSGDGVVGWAAFPYELPAGGTTGQILAKASGADGDVAWIPAPSGGGSAPALVAALPGSPTDGQEVIYQNAAMAALGVAWHLRYRAAGGTYKWEFVGGSPLYLYDATQYNATQSAYGYAGSSQLLVPLAGDYEAAMACALATDSTSTTNKVAAGIGIAGAVPANAEWQRYPQASEQYGAIHGGFSGAILPGLAAAAVVRPMYKSMAGIAYVSLMRIALRPVRVG